MGQCTTKSPQSTRKRSEKSQPVPMPIKYENIKLFYTFDEILSENTHICLYKATKKATSERFCIKELFSPKSTPKSIEKLLHEAKILQQMDHPNIIKIYEIYQEDTNISMVTEFCEGGKMFDVLLKRAKFSENEVAKYIKQIVSALIYMHKKQIVHRDISPNNLMFLTTKSDSVLKLVNFGESKHFEDVVKTLSRAGNAHFIAPEVVSGNYSDKSDVWSLGTVIYLMLCGSPPFQGKTEKEIILEMLFQEPNFESHCWKKTSEEVVDLLKLMINKNPEKRITMKEVYKHKWFEKFCEENQEIKQLSSKALKNLRKFSESNRLYRAITDFITRDLVFSEQIKEIAEIFRVLDKNGDGVLSKQEITQAIHQTQLNILDFNEFFEKIDENCDGVIEYSEFLHGVIDLEKEISRSKLASAFKAFDQNGDGFISLQELTETLGGKKARTNSFIELMHEADTNGDGRIDLEEFCNYVKQKNFQ